MSDFVEQVELLQQNYQRKLPPVHLWNPSLSGELDMRINREGKWFYLGGEIKRQALADMFSTILKKEGEDYFLVTPVEKWKIVVEDAPFVVSRFIHHQGSSDQDQYFEFMTLNGDRVVADKEHPLWMEKRGKQPEAQPYLLIRNEMPGLIHRNVYYQLVDIALEKSDENNVGIWSKGEFFPLAENT